MIDVSQASDARIYNYLLGETDHYRADREAVRHLLEIVPEARQLARTNRQFLTKSVRYLAGTRGIDQFLDHGSGLPTARDNVHHVARRANPTVRVAYVDNDPIVLAHARMMLDGSHTLILDADMLDTTAVLTGSEQAGVLNRRAAVGVLFFSSLHCTADDRDPWQRVHDLIDRLPSGSCLALSHLVSDDPALRDEASQLMRRATGHPWAVRSPAAVDRFFEGLRPVGGLIGDVGFWRPGTDLRFPRTDRTWTVYGGVALKP
ncbi:SAM-dependent methyltransferase [Streptomyces sp. VNUA24]|uniref:SAM-dependent methyltransferase n=1 Tax=Streptomyces sp. VNUA24 TaxID=3031131 RepID=UPI0023B7EF3E|nr:SAM-dependent methyltransferase [Streptomyces sp. VNUA24]WEH12213.1 SAM-dependent methyltransferase [Streptomyces sp. VNUA24]